MLAACEMPPPGRVVTTINWVWELGLLPTLGTVVITLPPMLPESAPDLGAAMTMVCLPPEVVVTLPMADLAMLIMLLGTVLIMFVATLPGVATCCKEKGSLELCRGSI